MTFLATRRATRLGRAGLGLVLALGGAGCSSWWSGSDTPEAGDAATPGACPASRFQDRIGGRLIGSNDPPPSSGAYLRISDLPHPHRILMPGGVSTTDVRPDRLSITLDEAGRIQSLSCE
ncbi:I78 family peptidase inhibitor [Pararhodospirillum oryzae]|uniref:Peptidase inhibitor I78 family protein n=1 Tax=Pararhodospirillum oryzae TaxID=478448 RepID=A0A512H7X3_9PROT|nr:I78 family peptidase inhibitor [Pararhodospirillum oryzae]GEO81559.1 hypothetical protein ROR02_16900 [Pararhodospirillum oryzae]